MFIVKEIIEPDFGCEGLPDGQEPMCSVILSDGNGSELTVEVPDRELYAKEITEGTIVEYTDGILNKK